MVNQSPAPPSNRVSTPVNGANGATNSPAVSGVAGTPTANNKPARPKPRVDVESLVNQLQTSLGEGWQQYTKTVTDFITGKAIRPEFDQQICELLDKKQIKLHNEIMMANLANVIRDVPPMTGNHPTEWSKKRKEPPRNNGGKGDAKSKRLKEEIMSLPPRERHRIRAIGRDAQRRPTPLPSTLWESRQAKVPKVPQTRDKLGTDTTFAHDIQQGFQAPLAADALEIPDQNNLKDRVQGIALQHGLLGGVAKGVPQVLLAGLENHLKAVLESTITRVRKTQMDGAPLPEAAASGSSNSGSGSRPSTTAGEQELPAGSAITVDELTLSLDLYPETLIEGYPTFERIKSVTLGDAYASLTPPQSDGDEDPRKKIVRDAYELDAAVKRDPTLKERMELAGILDEILA
ncbi:hypothetical protein SAICODRAFT_27861 [Saitoella complicata NRRL Y-17804]|uniref:Transcriptional coactivator HFI1/ADA1 n=1 Tax=Saitoella complicata (strain BCRC 22490 / CBS 7301 / JCM 7358 / NBRC 10748 / NRRL Y-17804) TaxID=698492 RepID=A0A0E9NJ93_SAICN|nr:uncharacterized protein SAICODRAFT_27861 [Saitoella complicata NRRL Y-17804]ODQ50170.1 hypothetical protein SAICODRAFT_27861 [Saitoella complicata NRRL Y-17804]GAO49937.1 hypothetical protein G7K_4073-t1 [Saitoella complicata NRRL Y-17804]